MPQVLQPTSRDELPDDVELLKSMLWETLKSNEDLTQQIAWLKRVLWGKKSERFVSPEQLALFEDAKRRLGLVSGEEGEEDHEMVEPPSSAGDPQAEGAPEGEASAAPSAGAPGGPVRRMPDGRPKTRRGGKRQKRRGRFLGGTVPLDTPFVTTHVCLNGAACPVCGEALTVLGADSRKRVEYRPGAFYVLETVVETGICRKHPHESLFTPEGPDFITPGGVLGNELLCNVIVDKHADNMPLHKQSRRIARVGVNLPDETLSRNVIAAASLAGHLVGAMRDELLASPWLQGDATSLPILIGDLGQAHGGQLWVYSNGETAVFQVSMTKHAEIPRTFLEGFGGVWLSDGTSSYNRVEDLAGVERGGCWAHARRYVFEARNDHVAAMEGLALIRDLFMVERVTMTLPVQERQAHRDAHAAPIVEKLGLWVARWWADPAVVQRPKSLFAQAVGYLHRQWDPLVLFLRKPEIEIHNNRSELLLRGPVVGRRAWLFAGSPQGADASAVWFSLVASCMLQGIDPLAYLRDVLPGLGKRTRSEVRELTPARWAAAQRAKQAAMA